MRGHLKAEDFMNLMEGTPVAEKRRIHLESCARCAGTLGSVENVRASVTEMQITSDEQIPEPEWSEFRANVRDALLSRAVKRDSAHRSWLSGMSWKPVAAWGLSLLMVVGLTTGIVLWNQGSIETNVAQVAPTPDAAEAVPVATISAIAAMRETDVFDDVIKLNEKESESLQLLLEDLTRNGKKAQ